MSKKINLLNIGNQFEFPLSRLVEPTSFSHSWRAEYSYEQRMITGKVYVRK
jgi:hypothetical protein